MPGWTALNKQLCIYGCLLIYKTEFFVSEEWLIFYITKLGNNKIGCEDWMRQCV